MAAAAGTASSLVPSTSQRRLPFRPTPTRQPLLAATVPKKTLTLSPKPPRLPHPLAAASSSSSSPSPPPPEDGEPTDPVKLAFARAAAYKKEASGSKEAFERALEYRSGNGGGPDGGSALLNPSPTFGE